MNRNKNEKFNSENLSIEAHLIAEISRIEFQDSRVDFKAIQVKIIVDSFNKTYVSEKKENSDFIFDKTCKM
jgi:hypothetical protein